MGELPDAGKLHRSGIGRDVKQGLETGQSGQLRDEKNMRQEERCWNRIVRVLRFVELTLDRAAVGVAARVFVLRVVGVVAAREELEARNMFQFAMIARHHPEECQQGNQH